jgi:hypothetical protein
LKNSIDVLPSPRGATQADGLHLFGQVAAFLQQVSELTGLGIENRVSSSDHPRPPGATFIGSLRRHMSRHFPPETLPWIVDSCHEIPEKPTDSPEAGFDGKMMAARCFVPGNHHSGNSRHLQCDIEATAIREQRRAADGLGLRRAFAREKNGGTAGVSAQHPLAKRGVLGQ